MRNNLLTACLAISMFFTGSAYATSNRTAYQNAEHHKTEIRLLTALSGTPSVSSDFLIAASMYGATAQRRNAQYQLGQLMLQSGPDMYPEFAFPFVFHFGR